MIINICGKRRIGEKKQSAVVQCETKNAESETLLKMKAMFSALASLTGGDEEWEYRDYVVNFGGFKEVGTFKFIYTFEGEETGKSNTLSLSGVTASNMESLVDAQLETYYDVTHEDIFIKTAIMIGE